MVRSSVNFQVPLIIIVPHREAPPLPLLPLPMTVTSYHGNQINLQDHGLSLHIAPVWAAWSTGHWAAVHKRPPQTNFWVFWDSRQLLSSPLVFIFCFLFLHSKPKESTSHRQKESALKHRSNEIWLQWFKIKKIKKTANISEFIFLFLNSIPSWINTVHSFSRRLSAGMLSGA